MRQVRVDKVRVNPRQAKQVHADLKHGPLASASFQANSAWLVFAAIAFSLTRAARALTSAFHAGATYRHHPGPAHQRAGPARPLSPQPPAASAEKTGGGNRRGPNCSTPPSDHPPQPEPRPPPQGPTQNPKRNSRTDRPLTHAQARSKIIQPGSSRLENQGGGSRLKNDDHRPLRKSRRRS